MKAGVIIKTKFYKPNDVENYSGLIDYIDRKSARNTKEVINQEIFNIQNDNERFYIFNSFRTHGIFGETKSFFTKEEKESLKVDFDTAQKNGSLLWSNVVSFDNEFLKNNNLIFNGQVNEEKCVEAARNYMNVLVEKENLNAIWSAGIHYDKKHIHIHFAITEPVSTRKIIEQGAFKGQIKGTFKQSSLKAVKSSCVNTLVDYSKKNEKINEIMRERIINDFVVNKKNKKIRKKINELVNHLEEKLPETYKWSYGRNDMNQFKDLINEIAIEFINTYHKDDFRELQILLKKQSKLYQEAYGKSKKQNNFEINKLNELEKNLGNKILQECRSISKTHKKEKIQNITVDNNIQYKKNKKVLYKNREYDLKSMNYHINRLLKELSNELLHYKNKLYYEYQQFLEELEKEGYNIDF